MTLWRPDKSMGKAGLSRQQYPLKGEPPTHAFSSPGPGRNAKSKNQSVSTRGTAHFSLCMDDTPLCTNPVALTSENFEWTPGEKPEFFSKPGAGPPAGKQQRQPGKLAKLNVSISISPWFVTEPGVALTGPPAPCRHYPAAPAQVAAHIFKNS